MAAVNVIEGIEYVNVTSAVGGSNAVNNPDDVMIVQALLKVVSRFSDWDYMPAKLSEPHGKFDPNTEKGIREFQKFAQNKLYGGKMSISRDGRVSPALGKRKWGTNWVWTIIALNEAAISYLAFAGFEVSHIEYMSSYWEQIAAMLKPTSNGNF